MILIPFNQFKLSGRQNSGKSSNPAFYVENISSLSLKDKIKVLEQFKDVANKNNNHTFTEKAVLSFFNRFIDTLNIFEDNLETHPEASAAIWRTLFETVVLFKVSTQVLVLSNQREKYNLLFERYNDYGLLEETRIRDLRYDKQRDELEEKYDNLPDHLQNVYEYDWLNPIFSIKELRNLTRAFHPTFRDLVSRTKESTFQIYDMFDLYKESSNIIHMSALSNQLIKNLSIQKYSDSTDILIKELFLDYLNILKKNLPLSKQLNEKNKQTYFIYLNTWIFTIKKEW